jgi:O-acetylhomoserine (thiol)-lyase
LGFVVFCHFFVKGNLEEARKIIRGLELVSHLANVGDLRTLIIQPAATTHSQLSVEA